MLLARRSPRGTYTDPAPLAANQKVGGSNPSGRALSATVSILRPKLHRRARSESKLRSPKEDNRDEAARKSFCKEVPPRFALSSLSYIRVSTVDAAQPPVGALGMESKKGLMWALCFLVAD